MIDVESLQELSENYEQQANSCRHVVKSLERVEELFKDGACGDPASLNWQKYMANLSAIKDLQRQLGIHATLSAALLQAIIEDSVV